MAQLLSNLPIGAKIKFGKYSVNGETAQPITWLVVAKNHTSTPSYPTNSVTLLTEKAIDLLAFDAAEPNNTYTDRQSGGNNRYSISNIDQWLNKSSNAGQWYTATHDYDQAPTNVYAGNYGISYSNRPGFLNGFSDRERDAILNTTIRLALISSDGGGYEDIVRKVFIPSLAEVGYHDNLDGGKVWEHFVTYSKVGYLTEQAYIHSLSNSKPGVTESCPWWLRSINSSRDEVYIAYSDSNTSSKKVCWGNTGVRPALNLSSTILVSDTLNSDGTYEVVWNSTPTQSSAITVPKIYGGKSNAISWSKATDPDGDTLTYQLECSVNGGAYTQIYSGASTSYAHLVPFGTTSVAYRVKATDPSGAASEYKTSTTITVINNNAPVISGADANLGVKSSGFTGTYTITDANNNSVTVTESIDGVQIRSLVATLGQAITYGITDNTWLALSNGSHTLTIRATDGIDSTVRTYTFTKLVETLVIRNSTPWVSTTMPSRIMLVISRNIPSTATFKVEVCNNGYDTSPTWEDCTDAVKSGLVHVFENTKKSASNWGVLVRVTVARNGATGACYVSAIGGNFE
jgi:hypothetical protein